MSRSDKIRKARSFNDILDVIGEIAKDTFAAGKLVKKLYTSVSAKTKDEVFVVQRNKPGAIKTKMDVSAIPDPSKKAIVKHMDIIGELHDAIKDLESIDATIQQSFRTSKNFQKASAGVKALIKENKEYLTQAYNALEKIANKHIPKNLQNIADNIEEFLISILPKDSYSNILGYNYILLDDKEKTVNYYCYLEITDLKLEKYKLDNFYFILSGILNIATGEMKIYLSGVPDFKIPGKAPLGINIGTTQDIKLTVRAILASNKIMKEFDKKPLPLPTTKSELRKFKIPGVTGVEVKNDSLYVRFDKRKIDYDETIKQIIPLINLSFNRDKRSSIAHSPVKRGTESGWIRFSLTFNPEQKGSINVQRLRELADTFDLQESEINKLKYFLLTD